MAQGRAEWGRSGVRRVAQQTRADCRHPHIELNQPRHRSTGCQTPNERLIHGEPDCGAPCHSSTGSAPACTTCPEKLAGRTRIQACDLSHPPGQSRFHRPTDPPTRRPADPPTRLAYRVHAGRCRSLVRRSLLAARSSAAPTPRRLLGTPVPRSSTIGGSPPGSRRGEVRLSARPARPGDWPTLADVPSPGAGIPEEQGVRPLAFGTACDHRAGDGEARDPRVGAAAE
ncbi:hypothetical protein EV644_103565 [Kribbella orskensis]|uniref:Uncharacterized protein n=1 Tax=Kribbella orskensis TaxID=2512216 RepID=A0ABY2BQF9_9ACTN|nr:hypothetical protein EV642_11297 [Kribbella sp. VKM Ac-2500]TCO27861.1 hypothetical protein EV644_103565 [Kribbella orskensis]